VCFISNHSWLWYPSFVVMRERLLSRFDRIWIDNLNGSKFETGKVAPDGSPDPSVFSTEANPEGIQVGTAIALMVKRGGRAKPRARYRDLWGQRKRRELLASLDAADFDALYTEAAPTAENRYSFRIASDGGSYHSWPSLVELSAAEPFSGLLEMRLGSLMSHDRGTLEVRMRRYLDPSVPFHDLRKEGIGPVVDMSDFKAEVHRADWLAAESFDLKSIKRIMFMPFDARWCYFTNHRPIWNRSRPELERLTRFKNGFVVTRLRSRRPEEGLPLLWTPLLSNYHLLDPNAHPLPVLLEEAVAQ
jgi:predicted helicase